jgi:hypothetical protein
MAIKDIVRQLGLDADTLRVFQIKIFPVPLRDELADAVRGSFRRESGTLTPRQVAKRLETKREELFAFWRSFGSPLYYDLPFPESHAQFDSDAKLEIIRRRMMEYYGGERGKIASRWVNATLDYARVLATDQRIAALDSRSNKNAARPTAARNQYLGFVLLTWLRVGGDKAPAKLTKAFLLACTQPAFPSTDEKTIQNWIERHGQWAKTWTEDSNVVSVERDNKFFGVRDGALVARRR